MTRKEEIEKTAHEFYKGDEVSTFVVAAQWADKTMIDKAVKWLEERLSDNITYVPETFYGQPKPVISEKGLEDFIKYLEE